MDETRSIGAVVARARRALTRAGIRRGLVERTPLVIALGAAAAAVRPLVWRLHDAAPWQAPVRALVLAAFAAVVAVGVVAIAAWRRRPTDLASARALDEALGLREVVASGLAFERDGRTEPMTVLAAARARAAVMAMASDPAELFASVRRASPRDAASKSKQLRAIGVAAAALLAGVGVGSFDAALLDRLVHPITQRESAAAEGLARAADSVRAAPSAAVANPRDPKTTLADAARRASESVKRGDRKRALEALDDLRAASRELDAREREQAKALRALRDDLAPNAGVSASAGSSDRPISNASEALKKMQDELSTASEGDPQALRKMSDRLARAEAGARARAAEAGERGERAERGESEGWSKAADALREAREAAGRGDREAMKRALERAEREIAAMEKSASASASEREQARDRVMSRASKLDRSLRSAMRGEGERGDGKRGDREGDGDGDGDGEGEGEGPGKPGAVKNGQAGKAGRRPGSQPTGEGAPGEGPATADRTPGGEARRVRVNGTLQARADVREGERAVSAIQGMGRGDDPRPYREVFPSYDSAVEDGLRDELVPAARRASVRRYFSSIRPGAEPSQPPQKNPE